MDERPAQILDKELPPPPPRPPLITPSLSPPGSRVYQRFSHKPAPSKRPRLSSTPSSSASARLPPAQPQDLRFESSSRLFEFWDQLAERYNKPLDEDDIVDLRALDFVQDRGVTSAGQTYDIGFLADVITDDASSQGAEDEEEEEETSAGEENTPEDDSADELDLISPPSADTVQKKLEYYKNWHVPPANEQDPQDAEAFREFEEAERRRRELYGVEEEEDVQEEDATGADPTAGVGDGTVSDEPCLAETHRDDEEDGEDDAKEEYLIPVTDDEDKDGLDGRSYTPRKPQPQRRKSKPPQLPEDDSSEDELAAWVIDDTPIPPRRSVPPPDDIIDLTESRSPSPAPPPRGRSQSRGRTQSGARSVPRSKSLPRARAKSKPRLEQRPVTPPARMSSPAKVLQLLTPPRSSCSAPDISLDTNEPPLRTETPSPKMPKPRPRYVPKASSSTASDDAHQLDSRWPLSLSSDVAPPNASPKAHTRSRLSMKPEVVITTSRATPGRMKTPCRPASPDVPLSVLVKARRDAKIPVRGEAGAQDRSKGKAKEIVPRPSTPEPAHASSSSRRSQSRAREVSEDSCSPQPVPPRRRKRKRVSSCSSTDDSAEKPEAASISSRPSPRNQPYRAPQRQSGYSPETGPPTSSPVASDREDEFSSEPMGRNRYRASSKAPIPTLPLYPPIYPPFTPRHRDREPAKNGPQDDLSPHSMHPAFPPFSLQQSQAMAWVSYLMAAGGLPPPPPPPPHAGPSFHPSHPFPLYGAPPFTPSHRGQSSHQPHYYDTPSSDAGPSRSSIYSTPTHYPQSYPYWFKPAYSSGTLPPSSPIPSSPINSSPVLRPASVPPGERSRARGRRVSFKLDANDRPLPPTPPRHGSSSDAIEGADGDRESDDEDARTQGRSSSRNRNASAKPAKSKGKGKARAASPSDEEDDEDGKETAGRAVSDRGRPPPRARTPGPPSRREQSVPRGSAGASSREKASARKK
ncbi:hypothetical protein BV20DRAFT_964230 [Pilatotrama ljubarskyi]|nr:hypothetical protein BV20DRAFT_964230 [Pilatotrama ljubarskyi]